MHGAGGPTRGSVQHSAQGSAAWSLFFRAAYRFLRLIDPIIRLAWRTHLPGLDRAIDLETIGGRTGRPRRVLVTRLTVDDLRYVGHPNGESGWIRNLETAPGFVVRDADGRTTRGRALVVSGMERERVIQATWSQQPFPASVVYWLAREHIRAVGVYVRLEPDGQ